MVLVGQACLLGLGRAMLLQRCQNHRSPSVSLSYMGSGNRVEIGFHFNVVTVMDPRTPKQPNSTSIFLWGSFRVFWNIAAARTEYHTKGLKQQEDILMPPWPELCGVKSALCSLEAHLCLGPDKGQTDFKEGFVTGFIVRDKRQKSNIANHDFIERATWRLKCLKCSSCQPAMLRCRSQHGL